MANGINLGKAYVQIMPSAEGISGKLSSIIDGEADSAGKSGGAKLSSALGGALKTGLSVVAGAAATGAAAVSAFAKEAVSSFAQYEQLVGGVEKLYGTAGQGLEQYAAAANKTSSEVAAEFARMTEAENLVKKNAEEAYRTVGLSANAYMETATSFSAALVNSLGGDTLKAAEMTDVAMRAMSDNVNVFGSDFASVQNAFQGFAKQNYTMLDNLKLGYGGTKSEMERLIADANTYRASIGETADLSIDSFADVVQAIQSVQEAQNIAGTTNKEAMSTIEGSAAATKAAWENVITAIGRGEGMKEAFDGLIGSIFGGEEGGGLLNNIIPRIQTTLEGIGDFIATASPLIVEKLPPLIEGIVPSILEAGITLISALGDGLMQALPTLVPIAFDAIMEISNALIDNLPTILTVGLELIVMLAQGIAEALPEMVPTIVDCVLMIVETLIDNVDMLIDAAIAIILALAEGLINSLPTLIEKAPEIVTKLITALIENSPKLIEASIELIVMLAKGLIDNLPKIVEAGVKVVASIVEGVLKSISRAFEVGQTVVQRIKDGISKLDPKRWGKDLIDSFVQGIKDSIGRVMDAARDVANAVKDFLGFSEPEKGPLSNFHTFAPDMMKLYAQGIDQNIGVVTSSVDNLAGQISDTLADDLNGSAINVAANVSGRGGSTSGVSMGGVTINVYGAQGQDEMVLAQQIAAIINNQVYRSEAVFA